MDNNKPWYEKLSIWVAIFAGICTILGFLFNITDDNTESNSNIDSFNTDTYVSNSGQPYTLTDKPAVQTTEPEISSSVSPPSKIKVTETHTPTDSIISVSYPNWNTDDDYGIDGKRYGGGLKVTISHMLSALGDNSSREITSRIMIPVSNDINSFSGTFVLHQSMYGSKSSAKISILVNNESLFTTDEINGTTLDAIPFSIIFEDADAIIIETKATLRGSDFVFGIVNSKDSD